MFSESTCPKLVSGTGVKVQRFLRRSRLLPGTTANSKCSCCPRREDVSSCTTCHCPCYQAIQIGKITRNLHQVYHRIAHKVCRSHGANAVHRYLDDEKLPNDRAAHTQIRSSYFTCHDPTRVTCAISRHSDIAHNFSTSSHPAASLLSAKRRARESDPAGPCATIGHSIVPNFICGSNHKPFPPNSNLMRLHAFHFVLPACDTATTPYELSIANDSTTFLQPLL